MRAVLILLGAGIGLLAAPAAPAPPLSLDLAPGPSAVAGPFRIFVERMVQNASLTLEFGEEGAAGAPEGRQSLYVYLAVTAPDRDRVSGIVGFGRNPVAHTDTGQRVPLRTYSSNDTGSLDGKTWRTYILAQEVDLAARRLRDLNGELRVYPRSRPVRLSFSPKDRLPQVQEVDGFRVTLQEFRWEARTATVVLTQQWPEEVNVVRSRPDIPFGVVVLSAAGVPTQASEGRSTVREKRERGVTQHYRLVYPDLEQAPDKIVVEALVRSGKPESIPFQLPDLPLPNGDPPSAEPGAGPWPRDHRDLVDRGGAPVRFTVRLAGRPAGPGTLAVGLIAASPAPGPCRWLSLPTDAAGVALLPNLRPGRYRATLRWAPEPGVPIPPAGRWLNAQVEFTADPMSRTDLSLEWQSP